jgi:hypothetical protein
MQLEYCILWVDDEISKLEAIGDVDRIRNHITDIGFKPELELVSNADNIQQYFGKKYDLIISDYSIDENHHGDEIIKEIRRNRILTEVLFYSSQQDIRSIAEKLLTYDRISFHAGRRELIEKIETLISLTVSKLLELNATRGLITAETSALDVLIEVIVMNLVYEKLKLTKNEIDGIIESYVEDFLKKSPDKFLEKYNSVGFKNWFHRIEASRKWSIFRDLLKKIDANEVKNFLTKNKTYSSEVIDIRNKFAHSRALEKDGKIYLAGFGPEGSPFEYDGTQCIQIRKNLIEHRNNFETLLSFLEIKPE